MDISESFVFNLAPIPMWLEDLSDVKTLLDQWRADGVVDLKAFLEEDSSRVLDCAMRVKIIEVNQRTLELFGASHLDDLQQNLDIIFRHDLIPMHQLHLESLWAGECFFIGETINYTLSGEALELQFRSYILDNTSDWSKVLVTTEDVTSYKKIARREAESRRLADSLFRRSPAALLMENFHLIKTKMDAVRASGVLDIVHYLDQHPEFVGDCLNDIIVEDINETALELFAQPNKEKLIRDFNKSLTHHHMHEIFREQLIMLWNNMLTHQRETTFVAFDNTIRHVYLQFTVFPGYEHDWSKVQIALTDITARKEAENYLNFLSRHDVLTNLGNRTRFNEELQALELKNPYPMSCIYLDLNGLKPLNDEFGHAVGDEVLMRAGTMLNQVIQKTSYLACRVGGDEFVILMPNAGQHALNQCINNINGQLYVDLQLHPKHPLNFSLGSTSRLPDETVQEMLNRADKLMYIEKQAYYRDNDRRRLEFSFKLAEPSNQA